MSRRAARWLPAAVFVVVFFGVVGIAHRCQPELAHREPPASFHNLE